MRSCSFKPSDLYPLLGLGHRPWIREGGRRGEQEGGHNGNQMFQAGGGLASLLLCDKPPSSPAPSAYKSMSFFFGVLLSVLCSGRGEESGERLTHADMHTYMVHTCPHRQPWLRFFPLAYLFEWPWKTKQVLSTFDFSAFKLILSAQLLKQLSSPAVSNFQLGTFTGCQVLSLHCDSLAPFLSKRYSNNL